MSELQSIDLGRSSLALSLATQAVERIASSRQSATLALVGDWGAGKSWLLDELVAQLEQAPLWSQARCTVVRFNPWYYADERALFAGFATLLVQQTLKRKRGRSKLARFLQLVGPSAKFGGVDLTTAAKQAGDALGVTTPSKIRHEIDTALQQADRQLLIVMDDIDRLNPDELLILFKLVRLVGDVPGLHYLLAYDEGTLHHLLQQTAIAAGSPERARRYLEKIIERRWEVPPLTDAQFDEVLLRQLKLREGDRSDPGVGYRLEALMRDAITTPRAASRYVDLADSVPSHVLQELDQSDLHLTLFVRVVAPGLWQTIIQERQFLVTGGRYIVDAEAKAQAEATLGRMRQTVADLPFGSDLIDLVTDRFPSFANALDSRSSRTAEPPRLGHRDFVDHYLWLDLPPGAVSEVALANRLRGLPDPALENEIRVQLAASPRLFLDALARCAEGDGVNRVEVFFFLERLFQTHGVTAKFGIFETTVDRRLVAIANDLLVRMNTEELQAVREQRAFGSRRLLAELVARLCRRRIAGHEDINNFAQEVAPQIASAFIEELTRRNGIRELGLREWSDLQLIRGLSTQAQHPALIDLLRTGVLDEAAIAALFIRVVWSTERNRWQLDVASMRTELGDDLFDQVDAALRDSQEPLPDRVESLSPDDPALTVEDMRVLARYLMLRGGDQPDDED